MSWNKKSSALVLGLAGASLIGAGSFLLGPSTEAAGPPDGVDVRVVNDPLDPVPVSGIVGAEQVGAWSVSIAGGIAIDPDQNEVSIKKGTRRLARFELNLDSDTSSASFDVDVRGSTRIRIAITVNGTDNDADIFLTSKLFGENNGSILDQFEAGSSVGSRTRVYDLPGEEVAVTAVMDDDDDDAFRQVIVTVWGD